MAKTTNAIQRYLLTETRLSPHQALDEKRFISDNAIPFAKLQADIIRDQAPRHWVTTNGRPVRRERSTLLFQPKTSRITIQ
ncbi:MAG: beta-galactosidase [Chitinophagaceae bacterium]|nr:beta-galactosidase [Chitinophagaceae bacterium]